jgi:hypothetical protein
MDSNTSAVVSTISQSIPKHNLMLVKQDALGREKFSKNSCMKDIHIVAKNIPFSMEITCMYNLHQAKIKVSHVSRMPTNAYRFE